MSPRPALAAPAAVAIAAILLVGCATGPGDIVVAAADDTASATAAVPQPEPRRSPDPQVSAADLQATLDAVASAFRGGDPDALRPWLYEPQSLFGERWLERVDNLDGVPLSQYELELDPSLPLLSSDEIERRYGPDARIAYVVEEHTIENYDTRGPVSEDMFLTFVRDDAGRWTVAADSDAEPLGLISVDHLWDHGPVTTTSAHGYLALHHPGDETQALQLLDEARRAREAMRDHWPVPWDPNIPVVIPRDEDELGELLHVTFELSNFVAFATSTSSGEFGDYELTGTRIVVNPDRLLDRDTSIRERILRHELLHVATRAYSGPMVPAWLEEGVAQVLGEGQSTTGTGRLAALGAGFDGDLPREYEFTTGGTDGIHLSYQLSWSFADYLVDRFGADVVVDFYAALGRGSVAEPGLETWHVDRAAEEAFGVPLADLRRDWADTLAG